MNVTFHALGSLATTAVLSFKISEHWHYASALKKYVIGFVSGIVLHGVLDYLPHNYPLPSRFDIIFALILFSFTFFLIRKHNRLLILFCFVGAIFPDLADLSAGIANKHLGIPIPQLSFKIFPWHWKEYSGSIYDGSRKIESNIYHISVLLISFGLIYAYRKNFFNLRKNK